MHEAKFLAGLCQYLVLQGYKTSQITILATYTGQMYLIRKEIEGLNSCKGVRCCAVDNFQGEENEIILLSLVRSNTENNIGFLKTDNRICVALSRAR
jgi:superfamily I DNA and/or RNA helicase